MDLVNCNSCDPRQLRIAQQTSKKHPGRDKLDGCAGYRFATNGMAYELRLARKRAQTMRGCSDGNPAWGGHDDLADGGFSLGGGILCGVLCSLVRQRRWNQGGFTGSGWGLHNDVAFGRQTSNGLGNRQACADAGQIKDARHSYSRILGLAAPLLGLSATRWCRRV